MYAQFAPWRVILYMSRGGRYSRVSSGRRGFSYRIKSVKLNLRLDLEAIYSPDPNFTSPAIDGSMQSDRE